MKGERRGDKRVIKNTSRIVGGQAKQDNDTCISFQSRKVMAKMEMHLSDTIVSLLMEKGREKLVLKCLVFLLYYSTQTVIPHT